VVSASDFFQIIVTSIHLVAGTAILCPATPTGWASEKTDRPKDEVLEITFVIPDNG
jgi:hypothetical protein